MPQNRGRSNKNVTIKCFLLVINLLKLNISFSKEQIHFPLIKNKCFLKTIIEK